MWKAEALQVQLALQIRTACQLTRKQQKKRFNNTEQVQDRPLVALVDSLGWLPQAQLEDHLEVPTVEETLAIRMVIDEWNFDI